MADVKKKDILFQPIFDNNPIALQILGICSALAVTTQMMTTLTMMTLLSMSMIKINKTSLIMKVARRTMTTMMR